MFKNLSSNQKRISKNIVSLFTLQGVNYILPLLTIPYLVRVLGLEYFGLLAFATAFTMYFMVLTDYGFNLSATNQIAINKNNIEKVNEIFVSVLTIKFIIALFGFLVMITIISLIPQYQNELKVFIFTYGMVIGQALIPLWLFQGLEKMKYMTYFNILAKFLATVSIFVFVQDESDYQLVPILTSFGFIIAGILSLYWAIKEFDMKFYIPSKNILLTQLKEGWHVFINNVFVNLYSTTNIIILGLLTNNTVVGYYSLAEKIIGAISGLFVPITQAIYPYMSSLYLESKEKFKSIFNKVSILFFTTSIFFIIIVISFGNEIITLISGNENILVVNVLSIICISILTSPLGTFFTQTFIIKKETKLFLRVVQFTFLTNMVLVFPMVYFFEVIGLAYTVLLSQIVHIFFNIKYYRLTLKKEGV
jgi:polysaccharide transporter, PST family